MTPAESTKVINFLATVKADSNVMKGHIINSLNALMMSTDPVSTRFCAVLSESINRASSSILNESAPPSFVPAYSAEPVHQQTQQNSDRRPVTEVMSFISDRASSLLL